MSVPRSGPRAGFLGPTVVLLVPAAALVVGIYGWNAAAPEEAGTTATTGSTVSGPSPAAASLRAAPVVPTPEPEPEPARDPEAGVVAPCTGLGQGTSACVQLSTQHAWLVEDGSVVADGLITSGRNSQPTPTGRFSVQWKNVDHYSTEYDVPMPYSVFFDDVGDALHGGRLDRQSAGCVHLDDQAAATFFTALAPGDPVVILE